MASIRKLIDIMMNYIDVYIYKKNELKKELHEASKHKMKEAMLQFEQMQHTLAHLESIKELNISITNGSDQEVLLMKKQVLDTVKRISNSYKTPNTQPVKSMEFIPVEKYKKSMMRFGHIYHGNAHPLNCEVNLPRYSFKGKKIEFKVITRDERNYLCCKRERVKLSFRHNQVEQMLLQWR